jgi:hypothetical protein
VQGTCVFGTGCRGARLLVRLILYDRVQPSLIAGVTGGCAAHTEQVSRLLLHRARLRGAVCLDSEGLPVRYTLYIYGVSYREEQSASTELAAPKTPEVRTESQYLLITPRHCLHGRESAWKPMIIYLLLAGAAEERAGIDGAIECHRGTPVSPFRSELTFLRSELTFLSSELTFLSSKLTFLSSKLTFLSTPTPPLQCLVFYPCVTVATQGVLQRHFCNNHMPLQWRLLTYP